MYHFPAYDSVASLALPEYRVQPYVMLIIPLQASPQRTWTARDLQYQRHAPNIACSNVPGRQSRGKPHPHWPSVSASRPPSARATACPPPEQGRGSCAPPPAEKGCGLCMTPSDERGCGLCRIPSDEKGRGLNRTPLPRRGVVMTGLPLQRSGVDCVGLPS